MNEQTQTPPNPTDAFLRMYERYADNAAFLWVLRSIAVNQPHYNKQDIAEFEERLQAHLDALMASIDLGWQACEAGLQFEEAGEVFTAAVTAFRSHEVNKIKQVVEISVVNEQTTTGFVSALGWLASDLANPWIDKFLISKDLQHKYLGLAACSVRRQDPGDYLVKILEREDCKEQPKLYARALRLVGELRRQDLMPALNIAMKSDNPDIFFWSSWSAVLLGNWAAANNLTPHLLKESGYSEKAIQMLFRILPIDQARQWITAMAKDEKLIRLVIKATGVLGDPHAVNWLIQKMRESESVKLAGESFSMITGIDLAQNGLSNDNPPNIATGPNDDPKDENVALDEDENLPWPDAEKIALLWQQQGRNFIIGKRYFMGCQISSEWLLTQLEQANQRQRHAAALELALTDPDHRLYNTRGRVDSL
jgi:uncharacterized protein (TIGR02270 family)